MFWIKHIFEEQKKTFRHANTLRPLPLYTIAFWYVNLKSDANEIKIHTRFVQKSSWSFLDPSFLMYHDNHKSFNEAARLQIHLQVFQ